MGRTQGNSIRRAATHVATVLLLGAATRDAHAAPTVVPFIGEVQVQTGPLPATVDVDAVLTTLAGQPVWGHGYEQVPVEGGVFVLLLGGAGSPALDASLLPDAGALLELTINGTPLAPPFSVGSVPYALSTQNAASLGGLPAGAYAVASQLHPVAFSGDYEDLDNAPAGAGGALGTPGRLARFATATTLGDAALSQDATGRIGWGTATPAGAVDVRGAGANAIMVTTPAGGTAVHVGASDAGAGRVQTRGSNGSLNTSSGPNASDPTWGAVEVADGAGAVRARMSGTAAGPLIEILGSLGQRLGRLGQAPGTSEVGYLSAANAAGEDRSIIATAPAGWGYAITVSPGGGSLVQATTLASNTSRGYLSVDAGQTTTNTRVAMYADGNGSGFSNTLGPNNQLNTAIGPTPTNPNHGSVGVYNAAGQVRAGLFVNDLGQGQLFGDVKSFRMAHPAQEGMELWYASLEGPEAAAYVRGTAQLRGGRAVVELPEHFRHVAAAEGLTVQVTPLSAESEGLAVVHKSPWRIEVVELRRGKGDYAFDYTVTAVRRGYESFEVVRPALGEPADLRALPALAPR